MANQRGMRLPMPGYEIMEISQMETLMENLSKNKVQFLLYIDYKYMKSHCELHITSIVFGYGNFLFDFSGA